LLGLSVFNTGEGRTAEPQHAIAMHGQPTMPAGFTRLP
jgi:hypothetical protein